MVSLPLEVLHHFASPHLTSPLGHLLLLVPHTTRAEKGAEHHTGYVVSVVSPVHVQGALIGDMYYVRGDTMCVWDIGMPLRSSGFRGLGSGVSTGDLRI